jgi:hypothetical protein
MGVDLGGPQPNFGGVRPEPRSALKRGAPPDEGITCRQSISCIVCHASSMIFLVTSDDLGESRMDRLVPEELWTTVGINEPERTQMGMIVCSTKADDGLSGPTSRRRRKHKHQKESLVENGSYSGAFLAYSHYYWLERLESRPLTCDCTIIINNSPRLFASITLSF